VKLATDRLLLDRDVGAANPVPMAIWGLIVASLLIIGSLPFFVGLAVVVPVARSFDLALVPARLWRQRK
jgi:uncharacterized membrane protein